MKAKVIYLQESFWTQLREDDSIEGLRTLVDVYDAISISELRTDIRDELWDGDDFLVLLWKKHTSGQSNIELYENVSIDNITDNAEELSSVYFVNEEQSTCEKLCSQYGVLAISPMDISKKRSLFKGSGFLLTKNAIYEERYLQFKSILCTPCNSAIIIDPYLLTKKQNIDDNLVYLLEAILPNKHLKVQFQLSIFSMVGETGDSQDGQIVFNDIANRIRSLRKGLNFELRIYAIGKAEEFHSRLLVTNNVILYAEDGFDVFKKNNQSSKNARFDFVYPRLIGDGRQDMSNYIRWIKVAKDRSRRQSQTQTWGVCENRLFDLVK